MTAMISPSFTTEEAEAASIRGRVGVLGDWEIMVPGVGPFELKWDAKIETGVD